MDAAIGRCGPIIIKEIFNFQRLLTTAGWIEIAESGPALFRVFIKAVKEYDMALNNISPPLQQGGACHRIGIRAYRSSAKKALNRNSRGLCFFSA